MTNENVCSLKRGWHNLFVFISNYHATWAIGVGYMLSILFEKKAVGPLFHGDTSMYANYVSMLTTENSFPPQIQINFSTPTVSIGVNY